MSSDNEFLQEALDILDRAYHEFVDTRQYRLGNAVASAETYLDNHVYLIWPVAVYIEALADSLKFSGRYEKKLEVVFKAMKQYWHPSMGACCASLYFDGNDDVYYDDNAQLAIGLAVAGYYSGTSVHRRQYVNRATSIVELTIQRGWNSEKGGVAWHTRTTGPPWTNLNACSTTMAATAACRLAAVTNDPSRRKDMLVFAWKCILWVHDHLLNEHGLVCDGLSLENGHWKRDPIVFTYNTGGYILSMSLLNNFPTDNQMLPNIDRLPSMLEDAVKAALDTNGALYEQACNGPFKNWADNTFFSQILAEGLVAFSFTMPGSPLAEPAQQMVLDQARFVMKYIRDPKDGMYFRSLSLYKLNEQGVRIFNQLFHANKTLEPCAEDRESLKDVPLEKRPPVKTLLGNAGAARLLFCAAEIVLRRQSKGAPQDASAGAFMQRRPGASTASGDKLKKNCIIS
ncbi:alpha-1,6- mannanase [Schizosaccharomyces japonicus yFS275]|uniref:Alpha-1,6-mannanase n=1 Tax=Schizosaccharomyces japonicus (strain yFS275 / FY16936) TaxID=402676 RepID=B6K0Z3_SCHJY|nr:alpha-1,6- mannanase [Schizosaccharomyces japonicus yFS275]EEB07614.1 alpha-1,6- mannanase [Schizosaccharomyces japonicus yFS275]